MSITDQEFIDQKNAQLHEYRETISTLTAKVTELEKDRERLEWMIENKERIAQRGDEYFLFYSGNHPSKTPREAIDAAMKESEKK